jgi:hypothetical protein
VPANADPSMLKGRGVSMARLRPSRWHAVLLDRTSKELGRGREDESVSDGFDADEIFPPVRSEGDAGWLSREEKRRPPFLSCSRRQNPSPPMARIQSTRSLFISTSTQYKEPGVNTPILQAPEF